LGSILHIQITATFQFDVFAAVGTQVSTKTDSIVNMDGSTDCTSYKRGIDGVFNMNGQMVRRSCSLEGLPKGMYVVNGKKIIIR
jgi:hypothetical protein